jgi:hypothetical protein
MKTNFKSLPAMAFRRSEPVLAFKYSYQHVINKNLLLAIFLGISSFPHSYAGVGYSCFGYWQPGNFYFFETDKINSDSPCEPRSSVFSGGGLEGLLLGCRCRTINGSMGNEDGNPLGHTNLTASFGSITFHTTAHLMFTNFNAEIGPSQRDGSPLNVLNYGIWEIQTDNSLSAFGNPENRFENFTTFKKTGGSGVTRVLMPFRSYGGTISVEQGQIEFERDSIFQDTTFIGPGRTVISGGEVIFLGTGLQTTNLILAGGLFQGTGAPDIRGHVRWTGGQMQRSFGNGATLTIDPSEHTALVDGTTFLNRATINGRGTIYADRATVNNLGIIEGVTVRQRNAGGDLPLFQNSTTITVDRESRTAVWDRVDFRDSSGTVDASDGVITFAGGKMTFENTKFIGSGKTVISGGEATFLGTSSGTTNLILAGGIFRGTGAPDIRGHVRWTGGQIQGSFGNGATLTIDPSKDITIADGTTFQNRAIITGSGNVLADGATFNNFGTLALESGKTLRLEGAIVNNSGAIEIQISETGPTLICKTTQLGGTLKVVKGKTAIPAAGQRYDLITCSNRVGAFSGIQLPDGFDIEYHSHGVTLVAIGKPDNIIILPFAEPQIFGITFNTESGSSYTIQVKTNLASGNWKNITNILGSETPSRITFPTIYESIFFRVINSDPGSN